MSVYIYIYIAVFTALKFIYAIKSVTLHMAILKYICLCPENRTFLLKDHQFWFLFLISQSSNVLPSELSFSTSTMDFTSTRKWLLLSVLADCIFTSRNHEYCNM